MAKSSHPSTVRETIGILICLVCLILGTIACFTGYLPKKSVLSYQQSIKQLEEAQSNLNQFEKRLLQHFQEYRRFQFEKIANAEGWPSDLSVLQKELEALLLREKDNQDENAMLYLIEKDEAKDASKLQQRTFEIQQTSDRIRDRQNILQEKVNTIVNALKILENTESFLAIARENFEYLNLRAQTQNFEMAKQIQEAIQEFPSKEKDLQQSVSKLKQIATFGVLLVDPVTQKEQSSLIYIEEELKKAEEERDYLRIVLVSNQIHSARGAYQQQEERIRLNLSELYTSWDEVLIDMQIDESLENSTFKHQVKRVTVFYNPGTQKTQDKTEEIWKNVSPIDYKKHEKHLGMVIRSKERGQYESEAKEVPASPPGYRYVGNTKYGQWEGSGSNSFWVFYGQYKFLETLFWGSQYRHVSHSYYNNYASNYRSGREFYGLNREYGTDGSYTRSKYGSSYYYRNDGYKDTGWKSSGGTKFGRKFSPSYTPPPSSSSSYSSKSSRSRSFGSGSRSFGK